MKISYAHMDIKLVNKTNFWYFLKIELDRKQAKQINDMTLNDMTFNDVIF